MLRAPAVLVLVLKLLFFTAYANAQEISSPDIPPYVARIRVIINEKSVHIANAFLIDREKGFLVTSAHVIATGTKIQVKFQNSDWIDAETKDEWINWENDLAIVKIRRPANTEIGAAELSDTVLEVGETLYAAAWVLFNVDEKTRYDLPYFIEAYVIKKESDWGITLNNRAELENLGRRLAAGEKIPDSQKAILYDKFMQFKRFGSLKVFMKGLSGSPLRDAEGKVVGVFSASNHELGLAIPAYEVKTLLKKVKSSPEH